LKSVSTLRKVVQLRTLNQARGFANYMQMAIANQQH